MAARVAADPKLPAKVNAVFQFNLAGDQGGSWVVDMKGAGEVRAGSAANADCTIAMSEADFVALALGNLNPMAAFSSGKLKITGNPMIAMKLQGLFG